MLRAFCTFQLFAAINKPHSTSYSTAAAKALNLFICATDVSSDKVAAALVASLKQLYAHGLNVYGVGGPALRSQGLKCIVTDEQYAKLATAEVVPPVHSYIAGKLPLPGVQAASKTEYLKIFRDVIWEAALHGCNSRSKPPQQPIPTAAAGATSPQQQQQSVGGLPAHVTYDAVISVGSPLASQQLLFALRQAEKAKVARLPVIVHYMAPGLWSHRQVSSSSKTWSQLADHVMCGLPFETSVLHNAGVPASFVGHPMVEPLLQSGFSNHRKQIAKLLQDRTAADHSSRSRSSNAQSLFRVGNAAAFWQDYHRLVTTPSSSSSSDTSPSDSSSSSSSINAAISSSRKRQPAAAAAAGGGSTHRNPLLLCLLPGTTEADICSSMPLFDSITKTLAQKHPNLAIAVIVPDILVEATREAVQNFSVPAVVAPEDFVLSDNALAAAAAAMSHPGPVSLRAVAAGVPLVCVTEKPSLLSGLFSSWNNSRKLLRFSCVPNLVVGYKVVPEFELAVGGDDWAALEAVSNLLTAGSAAAVAGSHSTSSSSSSSEWHEQRAALQEVLLKLVPPITQQQHSSVSSSSSSSSSSSKGGTRDWRSAAVGVSAPSECAAATVLELVALRKQQEEEQLRALVGSS